MLGTGYRHFARRRYDEIDFSGQSYILKPKNLIKGFRQFNQKDCAQYLYIASFRNYAEYLITGDSTLECDLIKLTKEKITDNSLLSLEDNKIRFLIEEL